jgi:hypothetical protein
MNAPRALSARFPLLARASVVTPETVGRALTIVAVLLGLVVGVAGIDAPFAGGHFASSAGIGVCADNMWRLHTFLPVLGYLDGSGIATSSYYMHHPLGVFWTVAALGKVFGFHNWVLRLPAVIYVTGTAFFLSRLARDLWGPIEGGLAALAFVSLPITLGYASYHDLEQPVMFGCVVATWGYARFSRTWLDRYALASAAGLFFAVNHDWQGYVWAAFFLGWLFVRGFVLPARVFGPVRPLPFGRYWALMAITAAVGFGIEVMALQASGQLADLLGSGAGRTAGNAAPLAVVLAARRFRIELMFTGLAIGLGKLALPVILARAARRRDELELLPLWLLLAAVVQYVVFKQGADVHIFWPHSFAAYLGLAVGALAATARDVTAWMATRLPPGGLERFARRAAPWAGLVLVGLPTGFVLHDGLSTVRLARETGGRFAEGNQELRVDVAQALLWFRKRVPATSGVAYHPSVPTTWALQWEMRPALAYDHEPVGAIPPGARTYVLDAHATTVADMRAAASRYHVNAVGSFWLIDPREPHAPLTGYSFAEHEPSILERLSLGWVEPVREVVPDPFVTWEWRTMMGQAAPAPTDTPRTLEQIRIAHNIAVARGDKAGAARWRAALTARFDVPVHATFENQTELMGGVRHRGAERGFTYYFLAGVFKQDLKFTVHGRVTAPPRLSTLPADTTDLDYAPNPAWPTTLWIPGGIYSYHVIIRKRPGTERLEGGWASLLHRTDAPGPINLGRF